MYDYVEVCTYLDQLRNAAGFLPRVDVGEDLCGAGGGDATEHDGDGHRVHDFVQTKEHHSKTNQNYKFGGDELTCGLDEEVVIPAARSEATAEVRAP